MVVTPAVLCPWVVGVASATVASHVFKHSDQVCVCSKSESAGSPHFPNQEPPRAQQLRWPDFWVPHLGHTVVIKLASVMLHIVAMVVVTPMVPVSCALVEAYFVYLVSTRYIHFLTWLQDLLTFGHPENEMQILDFKNYCHARAQDSVLGVGDRLAAQSARRRWTHDVNTRMS